MTNTENKVYFYYLKKDEKDKWICRLAQQYYEQGKTVCILCASSVHAETIDKLLWTFEEQSFVPHEIVISEAQVSEAPVLIYPKKDDRIHADVLINAQSITGSDIGFLSQFGTIIDFADLWDDYLKQMSRERYKILSKIGYEMITVENSSL